MNVLIIGQNEINGVLCDRLKERGYTPYVINDSSRIRSFRGESGNFTIRVSAAEADVAGAGAVKSSAVGSGAADASKASVGTADAGKASARAADVSKASARAADVSKASARAADASKASVGTADASKASARAADAGKTETGVAGLGATSLNTTDVNAAAVIITERVGKKTPDIDGGIPTSLFNPDDIKKIADSKTHTPVVVLLDYFGESPQSSTVRALNEAFTLARKKLNVIYLFRFMRIAGLERESFYSDVRGAGVTFIKYENLKIYYDKDRGMFEIDVSDGINRVELSTKNVISDCGYGACEEFLKLAGKLRLKVNEAGYINEDRYVLNPTLTSRKGVYYFNGDVAADKLEDGISYTLEAMAEDLDFISCYEPVGRPDIEYIDKNYAVVEDDKCAFCYTCFRACPHAAMEPDADARVMKNINGACESCGICVAVCPANAITMADDEPELTAMKDKSGKVRIICCENSGEIALRSVLPTLGELASKVDIEVVPCGGGIGLERLATALRFYGKVMALTCMDGACRHFDGNKRASRQAGRLSEALGSVGVDKGRIGFLEISHAMPNVLRDELLTFLDK
ncbi:MAG: hydrogenase iron-sulfur subunit [Oscillospiraceae bacterium]|nr:hydrogenase iron-sulfur subunit [Oscillospiraceae bacterium]